jgi:hypothetical protein
MLSTKIEIRDLSLTFLSKTTITKEGQDESEEVQERIEE